MNIEIGIENLKEGMILAKDVYIGNSQIPLLTEGEELDERKINHLMNVEELSEVTIFPTKVSETVPRDLKQNAILALKTRDIEQTVGCAKRIASMMESNNKEYTYNLLKYVIDDLDLETMALDICEFSVAFGKIYNQHASNEDRINIDDLAIAALLHNIGSYFRTNFDERQKLPFVTLSKRMFPNYDLTRVFNSSKEHYSILDEPVYAYALIRDVGSISHNAKVGVLLQCETEDGKGPLGFDMNSTKHQGKTIAQIICIASLYERFLVTAGKDSSRKPSDVLLGMRTAANTNKINKELTELFINKMPLYSIGTEVVLNDGTIAEVIDNNNEPEYPVVKVTSRQHGLNSHFGEGAILDLLLYKENIYITSVYGFGLDKHNKFEERPPQL